MKIYTKLFLILTLFLALSAILILSYYLPLTSYQEARRAVIIQETYHGHLLIPTYNGKPYFTKPPFFTWVSLPFFAIGHFFSFEIFSLRMVSILSYILIAFIIYKLQKKDSLKTLLALFILFSSFRFLSFVYRIDIEPLFIFLVLTSFYFLVQFRNTAKTKYIYLFYFFFALAFLTRGPLHFFLIPSLLLYALIFKDKKIFKLIFFPQGWLIFLIISFPWYILGYLKFGLRVFQEFIFVDLFGRLTGKKDPFYYYPETLLINFVPWFFLFLLKIKTFFRKTLSSVSNQEWLYFSMFGFSVLFLSFTGEKYSKYLLFLFPFVALFISNILLKLYSEKSLLCIGTCFFILNLSAVLIIRSYDLQDLRYKVDLVKVNLPKDKKIVFYKKENPLFIFYLKRPIPIIKEKKKFWKYFRKGYGIFTFEEIKGIIPSLVLPDPYKKKKIWYYYKRKLFPKNQV